MTPCQQLTAYAKSRETAYLAMKHFTADKAKAVSKIRQIAAWFANKPAANQLAAVKQCEAEIKIILPSRHSRFQTMRAKILTLIDQSHGLQNAQ